MVANHANRKRFIQSLKYVLETYHMDGIDLDWEFPNGFTKERLHFSQLLHEIRREYQREHRTYLLSVAVAGEQKIVIRNFCDTYSWMLFLFLLFSSLDNR
jgi:chitinase